MKATSPVCRSRRPSKPPRIFCCEGRPIDVEFRPLQKFHASTFIPQRRIVLDSALKRHSRELSRILIHELFHFVWVRLGNPRRLSYEEQLRTEFRLRARGELGWSAELRKKLITETDLTHRTRRWREYSCESFCDTAAFFYSGLSRHPEFTLAGRWSSRRREWFELAFGSGMLRI